MYHARSQEEEKPTFSKKVTITWHYVKISPKNKM
jgi:hypothetical protein